MFLGVPRTGRVGHLGLVTDADVGHLASDHVELRDADLADSGGRVGTTGGPADGTRQFGDTAADHTGLGEVGAGDARCGERDARRGETGSGEYGDLLDVHACPFRGLER